MAIDEESVNGVPRGYAPNNFALRGKIMMGAIIILFTIVLLILCLHLYARWLLLRSRRNRRRRRINFASSGENNRQNATPTLHSRGLELSILRSLPVFVFNSDSQKDGLECAVCLCEFEENEKGRLLPKCNHSFHIECIDMWFHSHSTCPLCRDAVKPDLPVPVSRVLESSLENPVEHQIPVDGTVQVDFEASSSEVSHCCRQDEEFPFPLPSSSSSSSTAATSSSEERASSDLFQKPLGFAITVDISGRTESFRVLGEELGFGPAISPSLKSPGNRILSLKRLLSRERRAAPSAFSCSFSSDTDLEQGRREQAQPHR